MFRSKEKKSALNKELKYISASDNGVKLEDGDQDVSQDPSVEYDEHGKVVPFNGSN